MVMDDRLEGARKMLDSIPSVPQSVEGAGLDNARPQPRSALQPLLSENDFGIPEPDDAAWLQQENENDLWYIRFAKYFLSLGTNRSVRGAYRLYCQMENVEMTSGVHGVNNNWIDSAVKYQWRERAAEWDKYLTSVVKNQLTKASMLLGLTAPEAVIALRLSLMSAKTRVAAAREILDRAGMGTARHEVLHQQPINSDEMADAQRQMEDWDAANPDDDGPE
jgi:hypothetical protein